MSVAISQLMKNSHGLKTFAYQAVFLNEHLADVPK